MLSLSSLELKEYLESQNRHKILSVIDLDQIAQQPRKTLYKLFTNLYKPSFEPRERIVLFTRSKLGLDMLTHVQKCASLVNISNFFILLCAPDLDNNHLEAVRKEHSLDDCVFPTLEVNVTDPETLGPKNTLITLPETFCFSPWAHLEISSLGEFRPCCAYNTTIKDNTGRPFNINTDNIETVYNSDDLKNLRKQFVNGEQPAGCSSCWVKEQHNGRSNRHWTSSYLGVNAQTLEIEKNTVENLVSLDIKLGNLCNFKCRICRPYSSSRIAEEHVKHFNPNLNIKILNKKGQWAENPKIWGMLKSFGNQLVNIDFYGGEPFLIKQHEIFLDYLIEHGYASKLRIHYNSNGSIYPANLIDKWKAFRHVDVAFSIDNVRKRFELERGGSWQDVESNLDNFLKAKLPNMSLSVFPTINIQNVYYLEEIIDWYETKEFDALNFNLLETPEHLSIDQMNQELSDLVFNKLVQMEPLKIQKYHLGFIFERIKQRKNIPQTVDQLREYMLKLDEIRNQNFAITHPEIADIIYKGNYHGKTI